MGTVLPLTECVPATDTRRHSQSPTRHSCTCPAKGQLPGRSGRANRRPLRRRQSRRVRKVTGRPWVSATSPEFSATSPENYLTPGHHFLRGRLVRDKVLRLRVVSSLVDLSLPRAKRSRRSRSRSRSRRRSRRRRRSGSSRRRRRRSSRRWRTRARRRTRTRTRKRHRHRSRGGLNGSRSSRKCGARQSNAVVGWLHELSVVNGTEGEDCMGLSEPTVLSSSLPQPPQNTPPAYVLN